MATNERKSGGRDATRDAAPRERVPGDAASAPRVPEEAATPRGMNVVPEPELEEAPELLGERSDYPAPYGEGEEPRE